MSTKRTLALILSLVSAASLASCSPQESSTAQTTESTTEAESNTVLNAEEYYQSVIAALEAELLLQKQENYISGYEYDERLRELEEQIAALKANPPSSDKPNSETGTEHSTENLGSPQNAPTYEGEKMSFRYKTENGTATVLEYLGGTSTVAIPSTINGYRVVAIADYAFANSSVSAVVIPPSVTSIGWFAFSGCTSLSSVSIPSSVTSIGYAAFDGCDRVTVLCTVGSYAAEYAASFGMSYQVI